MDRCLLEKEQEIVLIFMCSPSFASKPHGPTPSLNNHRQHSLPKDATN